MAVVRVANNHYQYYIQHITNLIQNNETSKICIVGPGGVGKTYLVLELEGEQILNDWYIFHDAGFINLNGIKIIATALPHREQDFVNLGYTIVNINENMFETEHMN